MFPWRCGASLTSPRKRGEVGFCAKRKLMAPAQIVEAQRLAGGWKSNRQFSDEKWGLLPNGVHPKTERNKVTPSQHGKLTCLISAALAAMKWRFTERSG